MKMCPLCRTPYPYVTDMFCTKDGAVLENEIPSGFDSQPDTLILSDVFPDPSLQRIVEYQRKSLQKFVLVEKCSINSSYLLEGSLYSDFTFTILNLSMYQVSIRMLIGAVINGPILFRGQPLSREAKLVENRVIELPPAHENYFTVRQWVNSDEAKDISETLQKSGNMFDFSRAIIAAGIDELPDLMPTKLDLTRAMQNADLENKIIELGNENIRLRRGLTLWQDRLSKIEELTHILGMFYLAYNQLEQREMLSKETANNLKGRFAISLHRCFNDNKITDEYSDNLPAMPDSLDGQKKWIDSQCFKLRGLIEEQRQELSDYIQKGE